MATLSNSSLSKREQQIQKIKNSAPVFIIGSQRSGTSFLYRLIQSYLTIGFGRDNGLFLRKLGMLDYYGDLNDEANLRQLLGDILDEPDIKRRFPGLAISIDDFIANMETRSYAELMRRFYAEWAYHKNCRRWGGKTPDYSIYADEIYRLFPDAKFVHIIRDGRDVALSLFNMEWGAQSPMVAAEHWRERVTAAQAFGKTLPGNQYLELRYEELVQHPEAVFERLIHFLDWDGDREALIADFNATIDRRVMRNNFDKWRTKMSPRHLRAFEQFAGDLLQQLGYQITLPPEQIGKPVPGWRIWLDHAENFFRKLQKGQGFKGLYVRANRLFRSALVKLRFRLNSAKYAR